jgi:hypothetical protein
MAKIVHLNARAVLIQNPEGSIRLVYENQLYRRTDVVPDSVAPNGHMTGPSATGDDYVITCMVDEHGPPIEEWPELAKQYLLQDEIR